MANTKETKMTPEQEAVAKAKAKPGRAVEFKGKFFIHNAKTGATYEMRKTAKEWEVFSLDAKKVVFTIVARHFLKRIIKSWTKATEGTDTSDKFAAATPAPKKSAGKKKAAPAPAKKQAPAARKPGSQGGIFANDKVTYKPTAGSGKYPGKVLKVGPNKVQISAQLATGKRPQSLWVLPSELVVVAKPSTRIPEQAK